MNEPIDYEKVLEELKVIQNRLTAIQRIIIKMKETEMKIKMSEYDKQKRLK